MSTVTANGGNLDGSYPIGDVVRVGMTQTIARGERRMERAVRVGGTDRGPPVRPIPRRLRSEGLSRCSPRCVSAMSDASACGRSRWPEPNSPTLLPSTDRSLGGVVYWYSIIALLRRNGPPRHGASATTSSHNAGRCVRRQRPLCAVRGHGDINRSIPCRLPIAPARVRPIRRSRYLRCGVRPRPVREPADRVPRPRPARHGPWSVTAGSVALEVPIPDTPAWCSFLLGI